MLFALSVTIALVHTAHRLPNVVQTTRIEIVAQAVIRHRVASVATEPHGNVYIYLFIYALIYLFPCAHQCSNDKTK